MATARMIAVCDILGFSRLLETLPAEDVVRTSLGYLRKALYHATMKEKPPETLPSLRELRSRAGLGLAWFSDTVLIYTLEETAEQHQRLVETIGWLVLDCMYYPRVHIRAGVSYGELYVDEENGIYVGKALVEAHELERAQEWSGGALAKSAERRVVNELLEGDLDEWWLTPYDIPLKENRDIPEKPVLAINWTLGIVFPDHRQGLRWLTHSDSPTPDDRRTRPHVVEKWENTVKFHDAICKTCRK